MKIAVEIGWGEKKGGARRVAISVLRAMAILKSEYEFIVYCNVAYQELDLPNIKQVQLRRPKFIHQVLWDELIFPHFAVPRRLVQDRPDVCYFTFHRISLFSKTKAVATIYDMTPFLNRDYFVWTHRVFQQLFLKLASRYSEKIITVSENSKTDICRLLNVAPAKVVVTLLASDLSDRADAGEFQSVDVQEKFDIKGPFVLYVGAIHPRKNVGRIIAACYKLKLENNIPHQIVIAGARKWMPDEFFDGDQEYLDENIKYTGPISDAELVALYQKCSVFVYPSLYEGFGLPVLEAMAFGAPVVTSQTSSLPEVAGDAAVLVDPLNVDEIAKGIFSILSDDHKASELRTAGINRASEFSWEKTAQQVLEVLESV